MRVPVPALGTLWFESLAGTKGGSIWVFLSACPDVRPKGKGGVVGLNASSSQTSKMEPLHYIVCLLPHNHRQPWQTLIRAAGR